MTILYKIYYTKTILLISNTKINKHTLLTAGKLASEFNHR